MQPINERQAAAQRLRLMRFGMSVALYSIWAFMAILAKSFGMIAAPTATLWVLGSGVILTVVTFWICFLTNFNLRFDDPSLTLAQCVLGLSWVNVFMFFVPEWRDLMISVYLIVLLFGVFQLSAREFSALAFISFSGFVVMTGFDIAFGSSALTVQEQVFRCLVVGSLLIWCAYFANHVGALRERLQKHNENLEEIVAEVTHLAERDHLTQAYNRRSIVDSLAKLREGALRYDEIFSVAIIDIDYFKQVNDRFGHMTGDEVLTDFAGRVRSELRLLDEISPVVHARQLGRYGGEEFILLLPRTDLDGAVECAERIRKSTMAHSFDNDLRITISAGVAQFSYSESIDALLRRADRAMYDAKESGRNQVIARAAPVVDTDKRYSDVVNLSDYQSGDRRD